MTPSDLFNHLADIVMQTIVSVSHWSTYQSERNFRDADKYVPERWLGDERYATDEKNALQPFSVGPRNCIGKKWVPSFCIPPRARELTCLCCSLALIEMRLILARLLWNFDLELGESKKDWTDQRIFNLWQKEKLMVKLVARKDLRSIKA